MSIPVTLDNCEREPIHIPGLVQPHGALIAFEVATFSVTRRSRSVMDLLGDLAPALGSILAPVDFAADPLVHETLAEVAAGAEATGPAAPYNVEVQLGGRLFDLVAHRVGDEVVAEFELRSPHEHPLADFSKHAHRAMDRLKRQGSVDAMLALAVDAVRGLTNFDRVMAYRFRHDDSGDIVAENHHPALDPFLGRRYPADDIPPQARRLYIVNTLRLIADVLAAPSALVQRDADMQALDMSHCTLRSVSPIHIEYLRNMGVGASMSISIVLNGKLWGMLACHHRGPLHVPYSVRMACDVLAQVLASNIQSRLGQEQAQRESEATELRGQLVAAVLHSHDPYDALVHYAPSLATAFDAHAVVVAYQSRMHVHGEVSPEAASALVRDLGRPGMDGLHAVSERERLPEGFREESSPWCGLLSIQFDAASGGWVLLLRKEQIETINWGGKPEKHYASGPLGPRLTPRGSFDLWKQTVRNTSVPWSRAEMDSARQLRDELARACGAMAAEMHRARAELIAILGHDLRDPLQSISMAAQLLGRSASDSSSERLGQRIQNSSNRMARLIGQVLDASRLHAGQGLQVHPTEIDLAQLVDDAVDEARVAYPGSELSVSGTKELRIRGDRDRLAQVMGNLVSNARHHGVAGEAILVTLGEEADYAVVAVSNVSPPIDPAFVPQLYAPFKQQSPGHGRNRTGLGLGLHIAQAVVHAHRGTIDYSYEQGRVVFTLRLPIREVHSD